MYYKCHANEHELKKIVQINCVEKEEKMIQNGEQKTKKCSG